MHGTGDSHDPLARRHAFMEAVEAVLSAGAVRNDEAYVQLFARHELPMWIWDVETLQILDANDRALALYGYTRDAFLCLSLRDIRPAADMPKFLELARDLHHYDLTGPWRHLRQDGSEFQVLITSHEIQFGPHKARLVIVEDPDEAVI